MWVSAWSASCTAQVKYSQSGIPFAIGVKDERERDVSGELGKIFQLSKLPAVWYIVWYIYCYRNISSFTIGLTNFNVYASSENRSGIKVSSVYARPQTNL